MWVKAILKFEKYVAGANIFGIAIDKFTNWQKLYLVILFLIYKNSEVYFYHVILFIVLTFSLKMKSYKKFLLDSYEIA